MVPNQPPNDGNNSENKPRRTRGAFPRKPFRQVLDIARSVHDLGEGEPVRRRSVFERLGKSADSSVSRDLLLASTVGYEITKGGPKEMYLELTPLGQQVVRASTPEERLRAIHNVLFANELFAALVDKFTDRSFPSDELAVDFLQRSHALSEPDAKSFWAVAKDNILEYGLSEESAGKRVILSRDLAAPATPTRTQTETPADGAQIAGLEQVPVVNSERAVSQTVDQRTRGSSMNAQFHFNIQVVLPENATPETYDAIFSSIATHLLQKGEA